MPNGATIRLAIGIGLLVVGLFLPLAAVPVMQTDWPGVVKSAVSGLLIFSIEILAIPAVAIMGKDNFDRIMRTVWAWLGRMRPAGDVGPRRHALGLVMFLVPILPTYVMAYLPSWLPDASPERLWVNLASDACFVVSLFVLGGDFWDKLRALFVRQARAQFPAPQASGTSSTIPS